MEGMDDRQGKMEENTNESKILMDEKAKGAKERAERSVPEYKAYAVEKMIEKEDSSKKVENQLFENKAKEGKNILVGNITDTAKRAMDFLVGEKDMISASPKEKYCNTEHEARQKMQELKLSREGYEDEDRKRAAADRETAQDRGIVGKRNIIDMMPKLGDIKSKFVMPSDIVVEARAREHGIDEVKDEVAAGQRRSSTG